MISFARAGLALLFMLLAVSLTSAAPIQPGVSISHSNNPHALAPRVSQVIIATNGLPEGNALDGPRKSFADVEMHTLFRRTSLHDRVKHAFQKAGHAIAHVAQKVGHAIKTAAVKVGHFVKTVGAQVAVFGMKLYATAEKIASKVVGFIPGIGKPLGKAMELHAKVLNTISDKIHVKLPGRLQKGVNALNKINKYSSFVPREFEESEVDIDMRGLYGFDFELQERRDFSESEIYEREFWEVWEE